MSDVKEGMKWFFNSKTITQLIFLIIAIVVAGTYIFTENQSNKQDSATLEEMKKTNEASEKTNKNIEKLLWQLLENQGDMKTLTRCVNKAINDTQEVFDNDFSIVLGETLKNVGVMDFPQKLNQSFSRYKTKFGSIKDCLVFPEDLK